MTITIAPKLEASVRKRAKAEGLSVAEYVGRLVCADQVAEEELEQLAMEGLNSGKSFELTPAYWEQKHRRLDERLKGSGGR